MEGKNIIRFDGQEEICIPWDGAAVTLFHLNLLEVNALELMETVRHGQVIFFLESK